MILASAVELVVDGFIFVVIDKPASLVALADASEILHTFGATSVD